MCRNTDLHPKTYVTITDQVMFANQDPVFETMAGLKSDLIDLEPLT
jgi:hypothetical protein